MHSKFKHLQSPDGKSSMEININVSPQAPAKPRGKSNMHSKFKHLQSPDGKNSVQININVSPQAPAKPRWQEQHANKHKRVPTSTCKAPMAKAACTTKFKHLQSPDGRSSMQINTDISLQAFAKPRWQKQHANKHKLVTTSTCKTLMARAACTTTSSICKAPMATAALKKQQNTYNKVIKSADNTQHAK